MRSRFEPPGDDELAQVVDTLANVEATRSESS